MNKLAQIGILTIMLAIFAFVTAVVLATPIKTLTDEMRNSDNLDCDADSLSMGVAGTCVLIDLYLPFFIGTIFFGGLGLIKLGKAVTIVRQKVGRK